MMKCHNPLSELNQNTINPSRKRKKTNKGTSTEVSCAQTAQQVPRRTSRRVGTKRKRGDEAGVIDMEISNTPDKQKQTHTNKQIQPLPAKSKKIIDNALMEYEAEICAHLLNQEVKYRARRDYMECTQKQRITPKMRTILIEWLVEVGEEYNLKRKTLFVAKNYIDRFMSALFVDRSKLQLLGVTALLIAAKMEEIHPPTTKEFVYICDNTYTEQEIKDMEVGILQTLDYKLIVPTEDDFIVAILQNSNTGLDKMLNDRLKYLSFYLAELTLKDYAFVQYLPSVIAFSAISIASLCMGLQWKRNDNQKIVDCTALLSQKHVIEFTSKKSPIYEKYCQHRFFSVAKDAPVSP